MALDVSEVNYEEKIRQAIENHPCDDCEHLRLHMAGLGVLWCRKLNRNITFKGRVCEENGR